MQTTPRDRPGTLVFWHQESLVNVPFPPEIFAPSFRKPQFPPISAHSASTVRASEKSSISTNRKSTTRFPTSHRWTMYVTLSPPKGGTKRNLAVFASKIQLLSKKVCYKVSLCETSSGKVVATSFLYPTVDRRIAGDVPIYLKFALKVTHFFRKRRFRQISLNSAAVVRASEKSSIIANRKSTMRFPSSHRWTLCVTHKYSKGWLKKRILTLCVALHTVFPLIEAGSLIQAGGQTSFVLIEAGSLTEAGGSKRRIS